MSRVKVFALLTFLWCSLLMTGGAMVAEAKVRVLVWDEQQPRQKEAYPDFLGNHIARHLEQTGDMDVKYVGLDDPQQGLSDDILDNCDVIVWWGHVRQDEVSPENGKRVVERIVSGQLSLITLHSAHWSTPFVEAMNYRTRLEAQERFPGSANERIEFEYVGPPEQFTTPKKDWHVTPSFYARKFPDGLTKVTVKLPICCFPGYRADGKPSSVHVVDPDHPIVKGVPKTFTIPNTEMYDEPFHVPDPDEVVFEERWPTGEWFRSGMVWNIGKGKVFYYRPGHETYKVFFEEHPLKIIENAVRWLSGGTE